MKLRAWKLRTPNQAVVLSGAAARSSMPNSSGSDFINQNAMSGPVPGLQTKTQAAPAFSFVVPASSFIWSPPPVPLEPIPEPSDSRWSPSGHIRYIRLGTRTTVTLGSATQFKLLVQEFSGSSRTPQGTIPSRDRPTYLMLSRLGSEGLIERRLHCGHSTPEPLDVKAARVVSGAEQLVGDVERGHDGDALGARHPACALDLAHLPIEISDGREKRVPLLLGARDLIGSAHDGDVKGLGFLIHPERYSGICFSRVSSRLRAPSIFSASCRLSPCNAASCWRNPRFSSRSRWHSRAVWRIFSSRVANSVSIGTL